MNNIDGSDPIHAFISRVLAEDLGDKGDITSNAIFSPEDRSQAVIKSKSSGTVSGVYLIEPIFKALHPQISIDIVTRDGSKIEPGTVIATLNGQTRAILAGERTALNLLQRLSGVATLTSRMAQAISHTRAGLLDTRKTTPLLRYFEKKAVIHGGGQNHRFGLYDMMLIKDTHVKSAGGVTQALQKATAYRIAEGSDVKIEVEVQSLSEFDEAIALHPDRIMLDNMAILDIKSCVQKRNEQNKAVELEASGNVTLQAIVSIAETGVDFISSGALTHSAPALDIHLIIT